MPASRSSSTSCQRFAWRAPGRVRVGELVERAAAPAGGRGPRRGRTRARRTPRYSTSRARQPLAGPRARRRRLGAPVGLDPADHDVGALGASARAPPRASRRSCRRRAPRRRRPSGAPAWRGPPRPARGAGGRRDRAARRSCPVRSVSYSESGTPRNLAGHGRERVPGRDSDWARIPPGAGPPPARARRVVRAAGRPSPQTSTQPTWRRCGRSATRLRRRRSGSRPEVRGRASRQRLRPRTARAGTGKARPARGREELPPRSRTTLAASGTPRAASRTGFRPSRGDARLERLESAACTSPSCAGSPEEAPLAALRADRGREQAAHRQPHEGDHVVLVVDREAQVGLVRKKSRLSAERGRSPARRSAAELRHRGW